MGGRGSRSASSHRPDLSKYVGSASPYGDVSRKQGGVVELSPHARGALSGCYPSQQKTDGEARVPRFLAWVVASPLA